MRKFINSRKNKMAIEDFNSNHYANKRELFPVSRFSFSMNDQFERGSTWAAFNPLNPKFLNQFYWKEAFPDPEPHAAQAYASSTFYDGHFGHNLEFSNFCFAAKLNCLDSKLKSSNFELLFDEISLLLEPLEGKVTAVSLWPFMLNRQSSPPGRA